MSPKNVELKSQPFDPEGLDSFQEMTAVPKAIIDAYAAQNMQVFFTYGGPVATTRASAYRCLPVLASDLDEFVSKDEKERILLDFEPTDRTGGVLRRGDAVLVSQPLAARDYFRGEALRRRIAQEDATDASSEQLEELLRQNSGGRDLPRGLVTVPSGTGASVREQAIGGPEIEELLARTRGGGQKE